MSRQNIKIAILGLGLENQALLSFWHKHKLEGEITVCDKRAPKIISQYLPSNMPINFKTGTDFNKNLENFDILFRSPGWPLFCPGVIKAQKTGKSIITSPMNLFFALCPSRNIIGVTGTKGKGTTSSLIAAILKTGGKTVHLGGNIGIAPFSFLNKIKKSDWVVLELSSFQLEDLKYSPKIAVITNIYPEHLAAADPLNPNYHLNYKEYKQAKFNIAAYQKKNDYLIVNKKISKLLPSSSKLPGQLRYFDKLNLSSKLVADFNQENIGAAVAVAKIIKIKQKDIVQAVNRFKPLKHRLELVTQSKGVKYYDNSFATNPESTILDLQAFKKNIILIAGGADKGADFKPLIQEIKKTVKYLVLLLGAGTENIKRALKKESFDRQKISEVKNMSQAVKLAIRKSQSGDTVLLSTACASFGLFKNYKERGDQFKQYVQKYTTEKK